jgi:hypothetical protein
MNLDTILNGYTSKVIAHHFQSDNQQHTDIYNLIAEPLVLVEANSFRRDNQCY